MRITITKIPLEHFVMERKTTFKVCLICKVEVTASNIRRHTAHCMVGRGRATRLVPNHEPMVGASQSNSTSSVSSSGRGRGLLTTEIMDNLRVTTPGRGLSPESIMQATWPPHPVPPEPRQPPSEWELQSTYHTSAKRQTSSRCLGDYIKPKYPRMTQRSTSESTSEPSPSVYQQSFEEHMGNILANDSKKKLLCNSKSLDNRFSKIQTGSYNPQTEYISPPMEAQNQQETPSAEPGPSHVKKRFGGSRQNLFRNYSHEVQEPLKTPSPEPGPSHVKKRFGGSRQNLFRNYSHEVQEPLKMPSPEPGSSCVKKRFGGSRQNLLRSYSTEVQEPLKTPSPEPGSSYVKKSFGGSRQNLLGNCSIDVQEPKKTPSAEPGSSYVKKRFGGSRQNLLRDYSIAVHEPLQTPLVDLKSAGEQPRFGASQQDRSGYFTSGQSLTSSETKENAQDLRLERDRKRSLGQRSQDNAIKEPDEMTTRKTQRSPKKTSRKNRCKKYTKKWYPDDPTQDSSTSPSPDTENIARHPRVRYLENKLRTIKKRLRELEALQFGQDSDSTRTHIEREIARENDRYQATLKRRMKLNVYCREVAPIQFTETFCYTDSNPSE